MEQERCPCCEGTRCCLCNTELCEMGLTVNPFDADVHRDSTLHRLCEKCYQIASEDI